jgi:histidine triad (HIT) family protein
VPKQEVDKLFDLDDDLYEHLMRFSKRIAKALRQAVSCDRVGMAVIGLEVPHAHVHLIPISEMHQMTFQTKVKLSENEFAALAEKITAEL